MIELRRLSSYLISRKEDVVEETGEFQRISISRGFYFILCKVFDISVI